MPDQNKVILIVDDSPSIRRQVAHILQNAGYHVREAGSRFGMLNVIEQYGKPADLIIMDLTLKAEHGFDLISILKESSAYKDKPILVLTEHADADNVLVARKLGVNGYMRKPVDAEELVRKIQALTETEE